MQPPRPMAIRTWPEGACSVDSLMKASLSASNAMPSTIRAMARRVSMVWSSDQVMTSGASRPVRVLMPAIASAAAITGARATCGSSANFAGSVSTFSR